MLQHPMVALSCRVGMCAHPGVQVDGDCYWCCKLRAALVLPAIDPPATEEQRAFVGLNSDREVSSWQDADSLLLLWAEAPVHPLERTTHMDPRIMPDPEAARLEILALMEEAP